MKRPRYMVWLNTLLGVTFVLNTALNPSDIKAAHIDLPITALGRLLELPFAVPVTVQAQPAMLAVGNTFQALVQVNGLTDPLTGFQLDLAYDPAIIFSLLIVV